MVVEDVGDNEDEDLLDSPMDLGKEDERMEQRVQKIERKPQLKNFVEGRAGRQQPTGS